MSFRINACRLAFLILSFTAVLIAKKYMHVKSAMKLKTIMLTAIVMSILLVSFSRLEYSKAIHVMEKPETEQMNLLVEAFSKGQVYFSWVPGEDLLALENPYDYSEREAKGAFTLFDGVYYNGYFCTCISFNVTVLFIDRYVFIYHDCESYIYVYGTFSYGWFVLPVIKKVCQKYIFCHICCR